MTDWFVKQDGKTTGPYSSAQLKGLVDVGKVGPNTVVVKDGKKILASAIKGLFHQPTIQPPPPTHSSTPVTKATNPFSCPQCGSENTQRVSVAYASATSVTPVTVGLGRSTKALEYP